MPAASAYSMSSGKLSAQRSSASASPSRAPVLQRMLLTAEHSRDIDPLVVVLHGLQAARFVGRRHAAFAVAHQQRNRHAQVVGVLAELLQIGVLRRREERVDQFERADAEFVREVEHAHLIDLLSRRTACASTTRRARSRIALPDCSGHSARSLEHVTAPASFALPRGYLCQRLPP